MLKFLFPVIFSMVNWKRILSFPDVLMHASNILCLSNFSWFFNLIHSYEHHVWVHVPIAARVCVDVFSSCCQEGHVDSQGLSRHLGPCWCLRVKLLLSHVCLGDLCCHLVLWWYPDTGSYQGPIWDRGPTAIWVCIEACDPCFYQGPYRILGSGQPPESRWVTKGRVRVREMEIWVSYTAIRSHLNSSSELLLRAMSESMVRL